MKNSHFAMRIGTILAVAVGCLSGTACGASTSALVPPSTSAPVSPPPAAPVSPPTPPAPSPEPTTASPAPTGPPKFSAKVSRVTRKQLPYSWQPGCPVPVEDLRLITMSYWGFDNKPHTGELVVNKDGTDDIVTVFGRLYGWRWPIYKMRLVDAYKGSDFDSIEADNTSAFNCRPAEGSSNWSQHAYGRAVDINPRENPYRSRERLRVAQERPQVRQPPGGRPRCGQPRRPGGQGLREGRLGVGRHLVGDQGLPALLEGRRLSDPATRC